MVEKGFPEDDEMIEALLLERLSHGEMQDDSESLYFESAMFPAILWIGMNQADFTEGASPRITPIGRGNPLSGKLSSKRVQAALIEWLGVKWPIISTQLF